MTASVIIRLRRDPPRSPAARGPLRFGRCIFSLTPGKQRVSLNVRAKRGAYRVSHDARGDFPPVDYARAPEPFEEHPADAPADGLLVGAQCALDLAGVQVRGARQDRKSTRLNSSHANISYAVFCL